MTMVYANLQPPDGTATTVTRRLVVSCTTFSPLPAPTIQGHPPDSIKHGRLFSSAFTCRRRQLPFSEVERLMLPGLSSRVIIVTPATSRGTALQYLYNMCQALRLTHICCKINKNIYQTRKLSHYFTCFCFRHYLNYCKIIYQSIEEALSVKIKVLKSNKHNCQNGNLPFFDLIFASIKTNTEHNNYKILKT